MNHTSFSGSKVFYYRLSKDVRSSNSPGCSGLVRGLASFLIAETSVLSCCLSGESDYR